MLPYFNEINFHLFLYPRSLYAHKFRCFLKNFSGHNFHFIFIRTDIVNCIMQKTRMNVKTSGGFCCENLKKNKDRFIVSPSRRHPYFPLSNIFFLSTLYHTPIYQISLHFSFINYITLIYLKEKFMCVDFGRTFFS